MQKMKFTTELFLSPAEDGKVAGGIVLTGHTERLADGYDLVALPHNIGLMGRQRTVYR